MLPARKTVSKKYLHEEHSSKTFGLRLASRLSYELRLHVERNSGHREDEMTHLTLLAKLKILISILKVYLETD